MRDGLAEQSSNLIDHGGFVHTPSNRLSASPVLPERQARILFGGDMMFDRDIRRAGEVHGYDYLLKSLEPLFSEVDLVVANLEGPITDYPSVSLGSAIGSRDNFFVYFLSRCGADAA